MLNGEAATTSSRKKLPSMWGIPILVIAALVGVVATELLGWFIPAAIFVVLAIPVVSFKVPSDQHLLRDFVWLFTITAIVFVAYGAFRAWYTPIWPLAACMNLFLPLTVRLKGASTW
jgi:hypothetical protein